MHQPFAALDLNQHTVKKPTTRPMKLPAVSRLLALSLGLPFLASGETAAPAAKVDFATQVRPILEAACVHCHDLDDPEGEVMLHSKSEAFAATGEEMAIPLIVPGKPEESGLYQTLMLEDDDDLLMPPTKDGGRLHPAQIEVLKNWIKEGAEWPEGVELKATPRIDFVKHIQPIFEENCLSCHDPKESKGDYLMDTKANAFESGDTGGAILPHNSAKSYLFELINLTAEDDDVMPPKKSGGPLTSEQVIQVKHWIDQGAIWPDGLTLSAKEKKLAGTDTPDNMDLVRKIHAFIMEKSQEKPGDEMKEYTGEIPQTGVKYQMLPIKGGEFLMGSPESEAKRKEDEGPQFKVAVNPFWMGKYEVTWDEYQPFMITPVDRNKDGSRKKLPDGATSADMTSQPTTPYQEMSFGMGVEGYPAISMTEHAALKYCQWLSSQTGHFYRLPTEAEWEYACRAGTTTAYSFGDDDSQLGDHAWFYDNSNGKYQEVGKKKPNPWGLYDMHGNATEWTLDLYEVDTYKKLAAEGKVVSNPWIKPETLYPRVARGGSWDDDPDALRSAARRSSNENWKQQDPQLPKSIWYHTDATFLGFRIIRPLEIPSAEEMFMIWNIGRPTKP